jgi:hypothetical protein
MLCKNERKHWKRKCQYFKKIGPLHVKEYFKQVADHLRNGSAFFGVVKCACTLMHGTLKKY